MRERARLRKKETETENKCEGHREQGRGDKGDEKRAEEREARGIEKSQKLLKSVVKLHNVTLLLS